MVTSAGLAVCDVATLTLANSDLKKIHVLQVQRSKLMASTYKLRNRKSEKEVREGSMPRLSGRSAVVLPIIDAPDDTIIESTGFL